MNPSLALAGLLGTLSLSCGTSEPDPATRVGSEVEAQVESKLRIVLPSQPTLQEQIDLASAGNNLPSAGLEPTSVYIDPLTNEAVFIIELESNDFIQKTAALQKYDAENMLLVSLETYHRSSGYTEAATYAFDLTSTNYLGGIQYDSNQPSLEETPRTGEVRDFFLDRLDFPYDPTLFDTLDRITGRSSR